MKRDDQHISYCSSFITNDIYSPVKSNTAGTICEQDDGLDELLAVLGYKVKSCDKVLLAEKLERHEQAMQLAPQQDQRTVDLSIQQEIDKEKMIFEVEYLKVWFITKKPQPQER